MQPGVSFLEGSPEGRIEFLGSMGHELRNPLANMVAQVETLLAGVYGPLEKAQESAVEAVRDSTRKMLQLVADVVDIGRVEAGVSPLTPMPCLLRDICESSLAAVEGLARSRSMQLTAEVQPRELVVMADAQRLEQIVTEMMSLAVLSVKTGSRVQLCITQEEGGLHLQTLSVDAAGQPVPGGADAAAQILGRLRKIKPIGLAVLQKLVRLHGGSFVLNELPGQETGMSIRLRNCATTGALVQEEPAKYHNEAEAQAAPAAAAPTPAHTRMILIADDQPALISVTKNYLESLGFEVVTATDGSEAVRQACELQPDLILMDVRMPVVDGLSAIRQIRASEDPKTRATAIVSLSGHASAADKEKCLAAGANAYLNKPFGIRDLDRIISEFLRPGPN